VNVPSSACPQNRQVVGTTILTVAIGCLIGLTLWGRHEAHQALALDVAIGAVSWALLPLLPRRPVVMAILFAALAAFSVAGTPAATVGTLFVAQRRDFRTAVSVGAVGVAAHAIRGLWQPISGLPYLWWFLLVVAAHAALVGWGALNQAHAALIASLRDRADRAEAEQGRRVAEARALERTRIAGEMHDVLAHRLSLVATYAGALEYRPDTPPEQLSRAAGVIRAGVHQALVELRDVLTVLRDGGADDFREAPQPALADLARLVEEARESGTPVDLSDGTVAPETLPPTLSRTVYRVVQEGLTNARKHAPGLPVRITLDGAPGGRLTVELRNPVPETAETTILGTGTGLIGLTERVRLAGGRLDHEAAAREFRLRAWLPFPACAPPECDP
jgi:signal transduction histidine kinase